MLNKAPLVKSLKDGNLSTKKALNIFRILIEIIRYSLKRIMKKREKKSFN